MFVIFVDTCAEDSTYHFLITEGDGIILTSVSTLTLTSESHGMKGKLNVIFQCLNTGMRENAPTTTNESR